jgi:hypothetical protein
MWPWIVEHWEFLFGVLGVIGVLVSIIAWIQQRQPKQLDYEIRSDVRLLGTQADEWREKLYISYGDVSVKDPWVQIVRIRNTGKKSISRDDFSNGEPITLMSESADLIDRQLIAASHGLAPGKLAEIDEYGDDRDADYPVKITPKLLSEGEWFDVQIFSDGDPGDLKVDARFADRRRPMKRLDFGSPESRRSERRAIALCIAVSIILYLFSLLTVTGPNIIVRSDDYMIIGNIRVSLALALLVPLPIIAASILLYRHKRSL